jgi:methyl-accepting chemotaxis protein
MKYSFKNLKLHTKLLIYIITTSSIIFTVAISIIAINFNSVMVTESEKSADSYSKQYANQMQAKLNESFGIVKGMFFSVQANSFDSIDHRAEYAKTILCAVEKYPEFSGCFVSLEIAAYGKNWDKTYGRFKYSATKIGTKIDLKFDSINITGDIPNSGYFKCKTENKNYLKDPYFDSYTGNVQDRILMTSLGCVLQKEGRFAGLVEADIPLDWFQQVVSDIKPYKNSYAFLLANNGTFIAHPNKDYLGKSITETNPDYVDKFGIIEKTQAGETFSFITKDSATNQTCYVSVTPINIGDTATPWSLVIVVPTNIIKENAYKNLWLLLLISILGLGLLSITVWIIAKRITKPIINTTNILKQIAKGEILELEKLTINSNDEIDQMGMSLNTLIDGLNNTANFANEIGKGNLTIKFEANSEKDALGNALLNMQQSLIHVKEEADIRKIEEEKRNWSTHGLATFGEILRKNNDDINELAYDIIKNLVLYIKANQGGLFIINDDNKQHTFLELSSCFAYDRRKFLQKTVEIGEGLIGACYLEKKTIFLTKIPNDYIRITSGLGDDNPKSLLIVPLLLNNEIFGVIELASFEVFEKFEIEFVEKVGESIASTIASTKINARTLFLLHQSQEQAEEMKAQEEEMRQNLEELHATQEEMARKEMDMRNFYDAIDKTYNKVEFSVEGYILDANQKYLDLMGYSFEELQGKNIRSFVSAEFLADFEARWESIVGGETAQTINKSKAKDGSIITLFISYIPIKDKEGELMKILSISYDLSIFKDLNIK